MSLSFTKSQEKRNGLNYQNHNPRIGIYGGTFDPIHLAHLIVAETVYTSMKLDEIWFLPSHIPPHKQDRIISTNEHRLNMLQLALEPYPEFQVNMYELEHDEISYTYNTINHLNKFYPQHQFFFIIGGDMVEMLPQWYRFEELLQLISFVAVQRSGARIQLTESWIEQIQFIEMPLMDLSSTDIRNRCVSGQSIRFLVPDRVRQYIKEHRLYVD